jgi:hypothetical protein
MKKDIEAKSRVALDIPEDLRKRLQDRVRDRNEDLMLDYLEEIEMHKKAIIELAEKINELSNIRVLEEDEEVQGAEEDK